MLRFAQHDVPIYEQPISRILNLSIRAERGIPIPATVAVR
jgi:hypothetical protein